MRLCKKNCTFFTKKRTFVCIKNRKRKAKALRLCGFLFDAVPRLRHAAFCHISCRGCDTLRFSYPCRAAAGAPRFVRPLPHCRCGAAVFLFHAVPRLGRCILSDLCRTAAAALHFTIPMPHCGWGARHFSILLPRCRCGRGVLSDPCRAAVCHVPAPLSAA